MKMQHEGKPRHGRCRSHRIADCQRDGLLLPVHQLSVSTAAVRNHRAAKIDVHIAGLAYALVSCAAGTLSLGMRCVEHICNQADVLISLTPMGAPASPATLLEIHIKIPDSCCIVALVDITARHLSYSSCRHVILSSFMLQKARSAVPRCQ